MGIIIIMYNSLTTFQKSLCSLMSHFVLFAYPIKLNSRQGMELEKLYKGSYIVIASVVAMQPQEITGQIFVSSAL